MEAITRGKQNSAQSAAGGGRVGQDISTLFTRVIVKLIASIDFRFVGNTQTALRHKPDCL